MGYLILLIALCVMEVRGQVEPNCNDSSWGYGPDNGPACWDSYFPSCDSGTLQSPINIKTIAETPAGLYFGGLDLDGYGSSFNGGLEIMNTGTTVKVVLNNLLMDIQGSELNGIYRFAYYQFSWGRTDSSGSEHTFNGTSYPLEMDIIHYNLKYANISEASLWPDGLASIAVEFQIGTANQAFYKICDNLQYIPYKGDSYKIGMFPMTAILPANTAHYYRYNGTLTNPPCNQTDWIVMKNRVNISDAQMSAFRSPELYTGEQGSTTQLIDNYRGTTGASPTVYNYDGCPAVLAHTGLILFAVLAAIFLNRL